MEPDKVCAALRRLAAKTGSADEEPEKPALTSGERRAVLEAAELIERACGPSSSGAGEGLRLVVSIDGAARGNPGPAGIGVLIREENGPMERELFRYIGEATNNVAEYEALLLALREAGKLKPARISIRSDSELLVRQIIGTYRVKNPRLAALHAQAQDLIRTIPSFHIEHVDRELNRQADALANRAINKAMTQGLREGGRT